jgi:hypothetical protein
MGVAFTSTKSLARNGTGLNTRQSIDENAVRIPAMYQ